MKAWNDKYLATPLPPAESQKPAMTLLNSPKTPSSPQQPRITILQVYKFVFNVMRFFGGSNFDFVEVDSDSPSSSEQKIFPPEEPHYYKGYPAVHIVFSKNRFTLFKYLLTKFLFAAYLVYFIHRFFSLKNCNHPKYCNDKGVRLLAIACYIIEQIMVLGIYAWAHFKRSGISQFFHEMNLVDRVIFGEDMANRQKFISRHKQIFHRLLIYFPLITFASMCLIGLNHWNHPQFKAHMTSIFLTEDESFSSTPLTTFLTIISFSAEFLLVIYSYLALYQFLFFSTVVARTFNWLLEYLNVIDPNEPSRLDFSTIQRKVRKYEHLRSLMSKYNSIFSGLLLFCKVAMILQIVIMSYIPLKRLSVLPMTSLMIFVAIVIHYSSQNIMLLTEMGRVHRESGEFKRALMRELAKEDLKCEGGDKEFGEEQMRRMYRIKCLLEGCNEFGFECAGCYVVGSGTVLTFFSIVTSYLIVMMQLQI